MPWPPATWSIEKIKRLTTARRSLEYARLLPLTIGLNHVPPLRPDDPLGLSIEFFRIRFQDLAFPWNKPVDNSIG